MESLYRSVDYVYHYWYDLLPVTCILANAEVEDGERYHPGRGNTGSLSDRTELRSIAVYCAKGTIFLDRGPVLRLTAGKSHRSAEDDNTTPRRWEGVLADDTNHYADHEASGAIIMSNCFET